MNVIPLFKDIEESKDKINNIEVSIPSDWWESSNSLNYRQKRSSPIYEFKKKEVSKFAATPGWDIAKGDYRVKESRVNTHDYVYYRDLKIKLLKYSIYPVTIFTMLVILKLSDILSKM
jgi:hypothetical protein